MIGNVKYKKMNKNKLNEELLIASQSGNLELVKYLLTSPNLEQKANIYTLDYFNKSPLMLACQYGHLELVIYLLTSPDLKEKSNINSENFKGWNSLVVACDEGYFNIAKFLIVDMNMTIDNKTMKWLEDNNKHKILNVIKIRDLHTELNDTISVNELKSKKIKI